MKRSILITTAVAAVTVAALAAGLALGASLATPSTTVATGRSSFGRILVDSKGRTLYLFEKDGRGRSACAGTCQACGSQPQNPSSAHWSNVVV